MVLKLEDEWVWDSWIADTGHEFHLFYLHAPRALGDQFLRHANATVGHAVSTDLRDWCVLPNALEPGPAGAWDDVATWTGSVIRQGDTWYMYYTGSSSVDDGLVQRLGFATSTDLMTWAKHPGNPISEPDPRWYERLNLNAWYDQAWRDPWVLPDPDGHGFHALVCTRVPAGAPDDARGVIGHAWSPDLLTWEPRPPLSEPGEFGIMEVPQVEIVDGVPLLLFCAAHAFASADRKARLPDEPTATFVAAGESLLGPWDIAGARVIPIKDLYSGRLVRDRSGEWQVIGFIDGSERDEFVGEISDPVPFAEVNPFAGPGQGLARRGPM